MWLIGVEESFAAAHRLSSCGEGIHGHTWRVRVRVRVEGLGPDGIGFDFRDLRRALSRATRLLDHRYLNELKPFHEVPPTAENLASWLYQELAKELPVPIHSVEVWESDDAWASYSPHG